MQTKNRINSYHVHFRKSSLIRTLSSFAIIGGAIFGNINLAQANITEINTDKKLNNEIISSQYKDPNKPDTQKDGYTEISGKLSGTGTISADNYIEINKA